MVENREVVDKIWRGYPVVPSPKSLLRFQRGTFTIFIQLFQGGRANYVSRFGALANQALLFADTLNQ